VFLSKPAALWLILLIVLTLNFTIPLTLLNSTTTIECNLIIDLKYLVTWLEEGKWNGITLPGGEKLVLKTSVLEITSTCGHHVLLLKNNGESASLPVTVLYILCSIIEIKYNSKVIYQQYFDIVASSRNYYKKYYSGSIVVPIQEKLMLETAEYLIKPEDLIPSQIKFKSTSVNSSYLISVFRNITGLNKGEFNVTISYNALVYIIHPYRVYVYSHKIPMYDIKITYNKSKLIEAEVYSYKPHIAKLRLNIPNFYFIEYMKTYFNYILAFSIILTIIYLIYSETRKIVLKHWRIAAIIAGIALIVLSFTLRIGICRLSYALILIKGLYIDGKFIPPSNTSHFKTRNTNSTLAIEACYFISNSYPYSINVYVNPYIKNNNRFIFAGRSLCAKSMSGAYSAYIIWRVLLNCSKTTEIRVDTSYIKFDLFFEPFKDRQHYGESTIMYIKCSKNEIHITYTPLLIVNYGTLPDSHVNTILAIAGSFLVSLALAKRISEPLKNKTIDSNYSKLKSILN